ncbi:MAG: tRNA (adenosine(37)-N6)-threonylcarbamoyltransferase complex ATPase subunit type 1 TsaE [Polyangiaceae bacterium]|nr:tRNA (adenosine(37)-N6)-threonylcarbamoyltransferase complex ATPase subunit type 1 TsaE [Myxococcales bacterium]MCB9586057.1 tRNA (adenosine(37)-N6)-threonylcarbamoyltransferase complex ATPase subunit type 1 TsaE [Polyangiaceae bacterium]MCB9608927.1 tRNA (adenosine(37)-N6)-threonylcarbamoyltransferase complex ATPase subunit type 1 TsaE [Polyangiaceae bacterium]
MDLDLPTRRSTVHLGQRLARSLERGSLVILDGPLGAGKTFLVRSLCRELGLPASDPVTSPTFTLVQEYNLGLRLLHADLYRLGHPDEVFELGLEDARRDGAALIVEWGRPYVEELGGDALIVQLTPPGLSEPRRAAIEATGAQSARQLERLEEALMSAGSRAHRGLAQRVI